VNTALALLLSGAVAAGPAYIETTRHEVAGQPVVVTKPNTSQRLPAVYVFSGLGEMVRGPMASANGWVEKYGLEEAMTALQNKTLDSDDLQGLASPTELRIYQKRARQYHGVVVVCVAAPRKYSRRFTKHLITEVIPWAESHLPVIAGRQARGLDGISLGGRHVLQIALKYPSDFRTFGTEQAAVKGLWPGYKRVLKTDRMWFKHSVFHLLSSHQDPFKGPVHSFAEKLRKYGVHVVHKVTEGRHDKRFAKGPGVVEMLLFHDKYLRERAVKAPL